MDSSPDRPVLKKQTGRTRLPAVLLLVLLSVSCSRENVLILSDPYVEAAGGGRWVPAGRAFRLSSRLRGFPAAAVTVEDPEELADIVTANAADFGIIIVSPYHARNLPVPALTGKRIIVAGGYPPPGYDGFEFLVPERTGAIGEMAAIAAGRADGPGAVLLVVNRNTPARTAETTAFMDAFLRSGGDAGAVRTMDIAEQPQRGLPDDFAALAGDAGLLVLLAASHNPGAILATAEAGTPILTEKAFGTGFRSDRVLASLEDSPGEFRKALLALLAGDGDDTPFSYPVRLRRK